MEEISKLQQENKQLYQRIADLQESVGRWKREAQGKPPRFEYVQQRHERGHHYISVPVEGLPSDTPLHEAQEYIRAHVLPKFYPFRYYNCYSSKRNGGWVATLVRPDQTINMDDVPVSLDENLEG